MKMISLPFFAIGLLIAPPIAAQDHSGHDMANMGHRMATPQEVADRTALRALVDQVSAWPPSEQTRLVWADIRDASKAMEAGDRATFNRFVASAKIKLAATPPSAQAPTPEQLLFRAATRYLDTHRQARIALDPLPGDKRPKKTYIVAANTKAALALVNRLRAGGTAPAAEISTAIAALDSATGVLVAILRNPNK
jgi:hypothetical protein